MFSIYFMNYVKINTRKTKVMGIKKKQSEY